MPDAKPTAKFTGETKLLDELGLNQAGDRLYLMERGEKDGFVLTFQPGVPLVRLHHEKPVSEIHLSPDAQKLLTLEKEGIAYLWDFNSGSLLKKYDCGDSVIKLADFNRQGQMILMPGKIYANNRYHAVLVNPRTDSVKQNLTDDDWLRPERQTDAPIEVSLKKSGIERSNGVIDIKDSHTQVMLAHLMAFRSGDWIIFSDDGYFMSSRDAARKLGYTYRQHYYTFDQFDLQYNRPDIVLQRLGNTAPALIDYYHSLYEKRLRQMEYDPGNFEKEKFLDAPEINFEGESPASTSDRKTCKFTITIKDANAYIDRLFIRVNGVPVNGLSGLALNAQHAKELKLPVTFQLTGGRNLIELSARNVKGIISIPLQFPVNYLGPKIKPDLYIVTIGAQRYKDNKLNLTYPEKDATDIQSLFSKANLSVYNKIIPLKLSGDSVTLENLQRIRTLLAGTQVDDQVVLFYAGHGLVDHNKNYYLGTYDIDALNPKIRGIQLSFLEDILAQTPARNRSLWIDACYSGEFDRSEMEVLDRAQYRPLPAGLKMRGGPIGVTKKKSANGSTFDALKNVFVDMRPNNGASILSAASGYECAIETSEWQNGIFTYCLINGLKNKAADENKDGQISASELSDYLRTAVNDVTQGLQQPTVRTENLENDPIIWQ